MKRLLGICILAALSTGCAYTTSGGTVVRFMPRGLPLQITHTCTDRAEIHQAGKGLVGEVRGATPKDFYFDPVSLDSAVIVTVQSLDAEGKVVGTYSQSFDLYHRYRLVQAWFITREATWGGESRSTSCRQ